MGVSVPGGKGLGQHSQYCITEERQQFRLDEPCDSKHRNSRIATCSSASGVRYLGGPNSGSKCVCMLLCSCAIFFLHSDWLEKNTEQVVLVELAAARFVFFFPFKRKPSSERASMEEPAGRM